LEDSRALAWDTSTVVRVILTNPAVSLGAIRVMAENVKMQVRRVEDLTASSVERRLARLLIRLAQSLGRKTARGVVIQVALSGQDLAELVGSTPFTVSRILAGWRRLDIADVQRERILILDGRRLAAIAGISRGRTIKP
jgi:CRP/FNR family transcriptional regulator, nitrogen oxide reductase regulator